MTILPKKKTSKEKNEGDTCSSEQLPHSPVNNEARGNPHPPTPRWNPPSSSEDRLSNHDPGGRYEEFPSRDGGSGQNKRRHRSSPHRNVRKHRHDRHNVPDHSWDGGSSSSHRLPGHNLGHSSFMGAGPPPQSSEHISDDLAEMPDGYNSEDEYTGPSESDLPDDLEQLEIWFERSIREKKKFIINKMGEDGACLFRAVADQIFGDQEMHSIVRQNCVDYMAKNADFFAQYITEDFSTYLRRKKGESCHGNHIEMQALCELYNRPIEVYQYSIEPINTFHGAYKTDNEPIRLSYHRNVHYNSLVNPLKATIGVGLGLPGFQPGLAEKNLMHDAVKVSENHHIEQTMLEDKLRETDWEVTQDTIEEQVARESYLQWLRDQEKRAQRQSSPRSASATCSSASESQQNWWDTMPSAAQPRSPEPRTSRSPRSRSSASSAVNSAQNSPKSNTESDKLPSPKPSSSQHAALNGPLAPNTRSSSASCSQPLHAQLLEGATGGATASFTETSSLMNEMPLQMYGLTEWDEDDIMAQVMAQSQQEYLDQLKQTVSGSNTGATPSGSNSSSSRLAEGKS